MERTSFRSELRAHLQTYVKEAFFIVRGIYIITGKTNFVSAILHLLFAWEKQHWFLHKVSATQYSKRRFTQKKP